MSVRRTKSGKYLVDVSVKVDGKPLRARRKMRCSKRTALLYEQQLRAQMLLGQYVDPRTVKEAPEEEKELTLEEFSELYMEDHAKVVNGESEIKSKEKNFRLHILPMMGKKLLSEIKERDADALKGKLKRDGKKPKGINNVLGTLQSCLNKAARWGYLDRVPVIERVKVPKTETEVYSEDAIRMLRMALPRPLDGMATLAAHTGLRVGELMALRFSDVNVDLQQLQVTRSWTGTGFKPPKSGKPRTVALSGAALSLMVRLKHEAGKRAELVFPSATGTPLTRHSVQKHLQRASLRAGVRCLGWHGFRHTFATRLAERGVGIVVIKELLGHSDIKTTMRYAHVANAALHEAVSVLDEPTPDPRNSSQQLRFVPQ